MKVRVFLAASALLLLVAAQSFLTPAAVGQTVPAEPTVPVYLPAVMVAPTATATPLPTSTPTATPTRVPPTPTSQPTATATATATPPPGDLRVLSSRMTASSYSETTIYVYVEAENGSDQPACNVKAVVRFYDAWGNLAATADGYAMLDRLVTGQKTPISVVLFDAPQTITGYLVQLYRDSKCYSDDKDVSILSWNTRDTSFGLEVFGEVRNDSGVDLEFVEVVVTFYGPDGAIWFAENSYLQGSHEIAAGQTGTYSISTLQDDLADRPYVVQSQGRPK